MTKINYEFIQKIFNRKMELKKNEDRIKLSKYSEYIPMYDIYSDSIYPISKLNVHYRLVDCHYRFITSEVKKWIENKLSKTKDEGKKSLYKKNLAIIANYDLDVLEETSQQTLYNYSPQLGLAISICKRNSFHPFARHLKPYYTKDELIKLGLNNKIMKSDVLLSPTSLVDKELHYEICKKVSKNDISVDLINSHMKHIIDNKVINWLTFYSMTGSYLFNDYLRNTNITISRYMLDGLKKIVKVMETTKSLGDDFYFYRFLWDDDFLKKLKVNDTFTDKGFLSTTRDPFYSPGVKLDFGLVLVKINVPKNLSGVGLFMENFSMFPKEEEFLMSPYSKLKLIARNDNFTYHHTNSQFEKHVTKKYEFNLIGSNNNFINNLKASRDDEIPIIDLETVDLVGRDRVDLFNSFIDMCDEMEQFRYQDKIFICQWFDSTTSYQHLYHNKTKDGLSIVHYKNGYPIFSIECGSKLVVNFRRTFTFYDEINEIENIDDLNNLIGLFCKVFRYEKALLFFPYYNFTQFKDNYKSKLNMESTIIYLSSYLFCYPIYAYYKDNKSVINYYKNKFYKYEFGYWNLDKIGNTNIPDEIKNKLPSELQNNKLTWKELFIEIVENYFYLYPKMETWFNFHHNNMFNKTFLEFDAISYLRTIGLDVYDLPNIDHMMERKDNRKFNLIFNRATRRI